MKTDAAITPADLPMRKPALDFQSVTEALFCFLAIMTGLTETEGMR